MRVLFFCIECESADPMDKVWTAHMGTLYRCRHCGAERVVSINKRNDQIDPVIRPARNSCTAIVKYGPTLTEKDKRLLKSLRVAWEGDNR